MSNFFRENVTLILPCLTSIILQVHIYSHWYYKHNQEDNCNISRKIANYCNWCTPFLTSRWHNHCHRNIWNHLISPSLGCHFVVSTCKSCKKEAFFKKCYVMYFPKGNRVFKVDMHCKQNYQLWGKNWENLQKFPLAN